MASDLGRAILVTLEREADDQRPVRTKIAAFLPITFALLGVAAILVGGVSARSTSVAQKQAVDPITTGSIAVGKLE
jgi:hypothetical protein